jgi:hypothetical protein
MEPTDYEARLNEYIEENGDVMKIMLQSPFIKALMARAETEDEKKALLEQLEKHAAKVQPQLEDVFKIFKNKDQALKTVKHIFNTQNKNR